MLPADMADTGLLDEAYERLHRTGPEMDGWLSNHGPMAADALLRLGQGDRVARWVEGYSSRLEELPAPRWPLAEDEWRSALGDPTRLGDWLELLGRQVWEEPWEEVLVRWWPRLLPGAIASATHGLIRTGHAVRALREQVTGPRLDELGQALGYWAARWAPVPGYDPRGSVGVGDALDGVPVLGVDGGAGVRARLVQLVGREAWSPAVSAHQPPSDPAAVPAALDELTAAAVARYARRATGEPVMLVHSATAPRAAALVLPSLPTHLWRDTYAAAWVCSAAITALYRPERDDPPSAPTGDSRGDRSADDLAARAADHGDEHVIKFAEVAVEAHRRGTPDALTAGYECARLVS
ncbi:questin oxidase family protein [Rhodococcus aerolatus]